MIIRYNIYASEYTYYTYAMLTNLYSGKRWLLLYIFPDMTPITSRLVYLRTCRFARTNMCYITAVRQIYISAHINSVTRIYRWARLASCHRYIKMHQASINGASDRLYNRFRYFGGAFLLSSDWSLLKWGLFTKNIKAEYTISKRLFNKIDR